jgi:hypothetical protein
MLKEINMKQRDLFEVTDEDFDEMFNKQKQQEEQQHRNKITETLNNIMAKRQERKGNMKPVRELREVHKKAIDDAMSRLKAVGCAFKIVTPINSEIIHDPNKVLDKRKQTVRRADLPYSYGDLKKHYMPYIENVSVGDVVEIPYDDGLPYFAIQSSLSAHLTNTWGKGSYTTTTNKKTKNLEVLRLA